MCKTWRLIYQCGHFVNCRLSTCLGNTTACRRGEVSTGSDVGKLVDPNNKGEAAQKTTRAVPPPTSARILCHSTPYLCLISKRQCGLCTRSEMEKKLADRLKNIKIQPESQYDDAGQSARGNDVATNGKTAEQSQAPKLETTLAATSSQQCKSINDPVDQVTRDQQDDKDFLSRFHWQLSRAYPDPANKRTKPRCAKPPAVESYSARMAKWKQSTHDKAQAQTNGRLKHGGSMLKFEIRRDEVDLTYEANPFVCADERKSEEMEEVKPEDDPEGWVAWRRSFAQGWSTEESGTEDSWSEDASEELDESEELHDPGERILLSDKSSSKGTWATSTQETASHEKGQLELGNDLSHGQEGKQSPSTFIPPHVRVTRDRVLRSSSTREPAQRQTQDACQTKTKTIQPHDDEGVSLLEYVDQHYASSSQPEQSPPEQSPWSLAHKLQDCSTPKAKAAGTSWFEVITI